MPDIIPWANLLTQPGQQVGPDIGKIISAQQLAEQLRQSQQTAQGYNAVGAMYADRNNVDDRGNLKPEAMQQLIAVAPRVGLDVQGHQVTNVQKQAAAALGAAKVAEGERERMLDKFAPLLPEAQALLVTVGGDKAKVNELMQPKYDALRKECQTSGDYPGLCAGIPASFDVDRLQSNLLGRKGIVHGIEKAPERELAQKADRRADQAAETALRTHERGESAEPKLYEVSDGSGGTQQKMLRYDKDEKKYYPVEGGDPIVPLRPVATSSASDAQLYTGKVGGKDVTLHRGQGGGWLDDDGKSVKPETVPHKIGTKAEVDASSEGIQATAELIAGYKAAPLSSWAFSRGNGPVIMQAVKELNPSFDATKYNAANRTRLSFAGDGQKAKVLTALNVVTQHLGVFDELAAGLKNKDTNVFNRVINYVNSELGKPEVTDFNTAKGIIADEVIKAVVGSGAVFDRAEMQKNLNSSRSPEQLIGQVDKIKKLMAGQVGGLEKLWTSNGLPQSEFYEKLLPETLDAIEKHLPKGQRQGTAAAAAAPAKGAPAPPSASATTAPAGSYTIRAGSEKADWDAIPSGKNTPYTLPDGRKGIKP